MEVYIRTPQLIFNEGSAFTATASFRNGETASAPSTAHYRIDCLTTGKNIKDWTALSAAASISITITATNNAFQDQSNKYEKRQITVAAEYGTTSEVRGVTTYKLKNLRGIS